MPSHDLAAAYSNYRNALEAVTIPDIGGGRRVLDGPGAAFLSGITDSLYAALAEESQSQAGAHGVPQAGFPPGVTLTESDSPDGPFTPIPPGAVKVTALVIGNGGVSAPLAAALQRLSQVAGFPLDKWNSSQAAAPGANHARYSAGDLITAEEIEILLSVGRLLRLEVSEGLLCYNALLFLPSECHNAAIRFSAGSNPAAERPDWAKRDLAFVERGCDGALRTLRAIAPTMDAALGGGTMRWSVDLHGLLRDLRHKVRGSAIAPDLAQAAHRETVDALWAAIPIIQRCIREMDAVMALGNAGDEPREDGKPTIPSASVLELLNAVVHFGRGLLHGPLPPRGSGKGTDTVMNDAPLRHAIPVMDEAYRAVQGVADTIPKHPDADNLERRLRQALREVRQVLPVVWGRRWCIELWPERRAEFESALNHYGERAQIALDRISEIRYELRDEKPAPPASPKILASGTDGRATPAAQRKRSGASDAAESADWPNRADLAAEAGISDDTLLKVIKDAGLFRNLKGAQARRERFSPPQVLRLRRAALAGNYVERAAWYWKWERWSAADPDSGTAPPRPSRD